MDSVDAASYTLDILRQNKQIVSTKKRKRVSEFNASDKNILTFQLLMSQPTDTLASAFKMSEPKILAHKHTIDLLENLAPQIVTTDGNLSIATMTVDDDNRNLIFNRPGLEKCKNGDDCVAHLIPGPPNEPLNVYDGPGADGLCILCIRQAAAMCVQMHRNHGSRPHVALMPPFTNLCDCVGGYRREAMGVTPDDQDCIKGGVWLVGNPISFRKHYNPITKQWGIDQGNAVYSKSNSLN